MAKQYGTKTRVWKAINGGDPHCVSVDIARATKSQPAARSCAILSLKSFRKLFGMYVSYRFYSSRFYYQLCLPLREANR